MTFMFLFTIFGITSKSGNKTMAGVTTRIALLTIHLFTIPVTGTSVNPARSFGPAIFAGGKASNQLWLFILAPNIGSVIAGLAWRGLDKKPVTT